LISQCYQTVLQPKTANYNYYYYILNYKRNYIADTGDSNNIGERNKLGRRGGFVVAYSIIPSLEHRTKS